MRGLVGRPSGETVVEGQVTGHRDNAEALGAALADDLLLRGARAILVEFGLQN